MGVYREELRRAAADDDAAFAEYVTDGRQVFPAHLREASRFAGRHTRGLVLEPRGHAKTELFIKRAARLVGRTRGRARIGILTAVDEDSENRSAAVRAIVESERFAEVFPWARGGVRGPDWTDGRWTVRGVDLGKDATMSALGLRSVRAGARLDFLLADDMVGLQENRTPGQRELALTTYESVVSPMLVPWSEALGTPGQAWFLGTRWHEDDLYATLIGRGWPHLLRKAVQPDGSALWPEYWPLEKLLAKRAEIGSAIFDLQYQNDPSGMGGNIFKREWFRYVDQAPDGRRRVGMDLALTDSERSDYTTVVDAVEDSEGNLFVCGAWRERLDEGHRAWLTGVTESGELITSGKPFETGPRLLWPVGRLPAAWRRLGVPTVPGADAQPRRVEAVNIESTQAQRLVTREVLAKTRLPAHPVYPSRDKVSEARALAIRYEGGKVFHVRGAPGIELLEAELVAFPNGEHDDLVDAARYAADLGSVPFSFTSASWR